MGIFKRFVRGDKEFGWEKPSSNLRTPSLATSFGGALGISTSKAKGSVDWRDAEFVAQEAAAKEAADKEEKRKLLEDQKALSGGGSTNSRGIGLLLASEEDRRMRALMAGYGYGQAARRTLLG